MSDAESSPEPEPRPAPRLGSYRLVRQLGSGGMSNVFEAVHEESGSVVALKVLPRTLAKNATLLQRFIREAKSAEALDHPNIAAIFDRGFDQGRHYLVLEYVEGRDLHDRVRLNGPLQPAEAIRFVREVAEGLGYAAGRGMIHRDVKPANLLMTPDGHAKIIDLGLALQAEDEDERVTRDGTTVGTVDYMAPEQARDSRQTSIRSDIYSLGCTFYYLMTGAPPFPGGGLADKLARHYKAPIPDVRAVRPEVPESLSLLIRRMMEKKPEKRFADYAELIAALDDLGTAEVPAGPSVPLDALIDEDDDEEIGLAPTESGLGRPSSAAEPLMAQIVDDDEDEDEPPQTRTIPAKSRPTEPAEISLAELAALDSDDASPRRPPRRPPTVAVPTVAPKVADPFDALLDEGDEPVEGAGGGIRRSPGPELSLQTWIAAGVMVGLAIAAVGFGLSMVISYSKPTPAVASKEGPEPEPEPEPAEPRPSPRPVAPRPSLVRPAANSPLAKDSTTPGTRAPDVVVPARPAEETTYSKEWAERLAPPALAPEPAGEDRPRVVVRRWVEPGDEPQAPSIASALGRAGDVVEIADTGPFFEDDYQVVGRTRRIRARPGLRPILMVDATTQEVVKSQEAKFVVDGSRMERLILEGLDIAVDLRDVPEKQAALFLCRGAELILRDCSITLVNAGDRRASRFSVVRVEEGARPSRVVLERSTIRGPIRTLVDLSAARAEVVLDRSMVVGEAGPLIAVEPAEKPSRALFFHRSILACRGSILEVGPKGPPLLVRSLGSTFARIEGETAPGFVQVKGIWPGSPGGPLGWSGEDNAFLGWPAWMVSVADSAVRVTGLDGVRASWPGSDNSSVESPSPWPPTLARDDLGPDDLAAYLPARRATLGRIASPHPRLRELTTGSLSRLPTPEFSATLIPAFVPPPVAPVTPPAMPAVTPGPVAKPKAVPPKPNMNGPVRKGPARPGPSPPGIPAQAAPAPAPPLVDLVFDTSAAPWSGDLGRFLAEKLVPGTLRATVRVRGAGTFAMSPVRLPDGLSLGVLGEPPAGPRAGWATFVPGPTSSGRPMFDLRGGDLALADLAFSNEGPTRPKGWVRVEAGLLGIRHCRFRDPGGTGPDAGPVIAFVAPGSEPIRPRAGPFASATDRPAARLKDCLIWTGGDAISAEVGRGVVDLENCLVISGGPAITLKPSPVAPARFEADLVMERCTIADDRTAVALGPWPDDSAGPARPWLVSTRSCAFPRTQVGGAGSLLQFDPEAMARGVVFWQSIFDAYEVARFLAPDGPTPAASPPADIKKGWVDVWGAGHARSDRGPAPPRNEHVLRYKDKERPRPGRITPAALELDPKAHKDLGVDFSALPPAPKS